MKKYRIPFLFAVPALALCFAAGCSGGATEESDEGLVPTSGGTAGAVLVEVKSDGTATISGTVTYDGEPPAMGELPGLRSHGDKDHCLRGDVKEQTWKVDPASKGVANVVVWVAPPTGQLFRKPENKTWQDVVEVDQPFCTFIPHVVVLYPSAFNGTTIEKTGQVLKIKNSAPISHNINIAGSSQFNPARNSSLSSKSFLDLEPNLDKVEIGMKCDIHKWMNGFALTFNHPYAAVTDKDGKFTIKDVPAGAEVTIMAWHEGLRKFPPAVAGGAKVKLEKGKPLDASFKVQAR